MLDIAGGFNAPPRSNPPIEFLTIQLMPLADGKLSVSLKSTMFDETELELTDLDLAHESVETLEQALAVIRQNVTGVASSLAL